MAFFPVGIEGLEPSCHKGHAPQTCVYTNSTISPKQNWNANETKAAIRTQQHQTTRTTKFLAIPTQEGILPPFLSHLLPLRPS